MDPTTSLGGDLSHYNVMLKEYQHLQFKSFWTGRSGDDKSVDVVHVMVTSQNEDTHSLDGLVPSRKTANIREVIFRFKMTSFLQGSLTSASIGRLAGELLADLAMMLSDDKAPNRAILLVAYDFGSLVVKKALSLLAGAEGERRFPGIFTSIPRIVFSGCPQRGPNPSALAFRLWELLSDERTEKLEDHGKWSHLVTVDSVKHLADAVLETTELFIKSKFSLRGRIISIFAEESSEGAEGGPRGRLHPLLDSFTATVGVPPEVATADRQPSDSQNASGPLCLHLTYKHEGWFTHPDWLPVERALTSLSPPHRQLQCPPLASLPSALSGHPKFRAWTEPVRSSALRLHGGSPEKARDLADQIFLEWQARPRKYMTGGYQARVFSFTFDSRDPLRNSLAAMLPALLLAFTSHCAYSLRDECNLVRDRLLLDCGWSIKSCISRLEAVTGLLRGRDTLLLLHNFDECESASRVAFMGYFLSLADRSENPIKLLLTSKQREPLFSDNPGCYAEITWEELEASAAKRENREGQESRETILPESAPESGSDPSVQATIDDLARRCPVESERDRIKTALARLENMESCKFHEIIKLVKRHSGWPDDDPSLQSLAKFSAACELVAPEDDLSLVLDKLLRSSGNPDGLSWALSWIVCGSRPLSPRELADVLLHQPKRAVPAATGLADTTATGACEPYRRASPTELDNAVVKLKSQLRAVAEFSSDQVMLRRDVPPLLPCPDHEALAARPVWCQSGESAHKEIAAFCLDTVTSVETILLLGYDPQLEHQAQQRYVLPSPFVTDANDLRFYVVEALPFHLLRCPQPYISSVIESIISGPTGELLRPWAQCYWRMSSPFSQQPDPPKSAIPVLAGLGMLSVDQTRRAINAEANGANGLLGQCLVAAAGSGSNGLALELLRDLEDSQGLQDPPEPGATEGDILGNEDGHWDNRGIATVVDAVSAAVRAVNSGLAVIITERLIARSPGIGATLPDSLLWSAAWLDMAWFAGMLLDDGARPDPQDKDRVKEEKKQKKEPDEYEIIAQDNNQDQDEKPDDRNGNEKTDPQTKTEAKAGQLPQTNFFPSPLYMAAYLGHASTVRVLLAHGARLGDVLRTNNHNIQRGIMYDVALKGHVDVMRALVEHNRSCVEARIPESPLLAATYNGNWRMAAALTDCGVRPDVRERSENSSGWTPLTSACSYGFHKTTQVLIMGGADPNYLALDAPNEITPLSIAALGGRSLSCVSLLLAAGADPDKMTDDRTPLLHRLVSLAALGADKDADPESGADMDTVLAICDLLVANKPPLNVNARSPGDNDRTALMFACQSGDALLPMIRWLLSHDANIDDVDRDNRPAIFHAAIQGNRGVFEELLKHGPKLDTVSDAESVPLIHYLAGMKDATMLRLLLESGGADPQMASPSGVRPISSASSAGSREAVKLLVAQKVDLDVRDAYGWPPIWDAVGYVRDAEMVRILAEAGADLGATLGNSTSKVTLVHRALSTDPEIMRVLLEFRGGGLLDIEARTSTGRTPLAQADPTSNIECLRMLVRAGADLNAEDDGGMAPLHRALAQGMTEFADLLLAATRKTKNKNMNKPPLLPGVDVDLAADARGTPLMIAARRADRAHVLALLDRGADVNMVVPLAQASTALTAALLPFPIEADNYYSSRRGGGRRDEPPPAAAATAEDSGGGAGADGGNDELQTEFDAIVAAGMTSADQIARELIRRGADVDGAARGTFLTPLAAACLGGAGVSIIKYLVDCGALVSRVHEPTGRMPLHFAAAGGVASLRAALGAFSGGSGGDDVLVSDKWGKNVVHWAAQFGDVKALEEIVARVVAGSVSGGGSGGVGQPLRRARSATPYGEVCGEVVVGGIGVGGVGLSSSMVAGGGGLSIFSSQAVAASTTTSNGPTLSGDRDNYSPGGSSITISGTALSISSSVVAGAAMMSSSPSASRFSLVTTSTAAAATMRPRVFVDALNVADADGWTPLCWAVRPAAQPGSGRWGEAYGSRPDKRDSVADVVRALLRLGADHTRDVKCRIGRRPGPSEGVEKEEEREEVLSLLELAERCGADEEVMGLLRYGLEWVPSREEKENEGKEEDGEAAATSDGEERGEEQRSTARKWSVWRSICDICLSAIYGLTFCCRTCQDFVVCKKCLASVDTFHTAEIMGTEDSLNAVERKKQRKKAKANNEEEGGKEGGGNEEGDKKEAEEEDDGMHRFVVESTRDEWQDPPSPASAPSPTPPAPVRLLAQPEIPAGDVTFDTSYDEDVDGGIEQDEPDE